MTAWSSAESCAVAVYELSVGFGFVARASSASDGVCDGAGEAATELRPSMTAIVQTLAAGGFAESFIDDRYSATLAGAPAFLQECRLRKNSIAARRRRHSLTRSPIATGFSGWAPG